MQSSSNHQPVLFDYDLYFPRAPRRPAVRIGFPLGVVNNFWFPIDNVISKCASLEYANLDIFHTLIGHIITRLGPS